MAASDEWDPPTGDDGKVRDSRGRPSPGLGWHLCRTADGKGYRWMPWQRATARVAETKYLRRGPTWAKWAEGLAEHMGMTPAEAILQALEAMAERSGYDAPRPAWPRPSRPDFLRGKRKPSQDSE